MSIWSGKGYLITVIESEVTCPICDQVFDASTKMSKAKYPVFNTKCPFCKGKITISEPIFGGELRCWETNCPKSVKRLETITENKINGIPVSQLIKSEDDDEDDEDDEDWQTKPVKPRVKK
jgi:tRNA G26 N,N-dimethylase Trm1